jgi:Raf kinase inhibitor-like YbhB/YbcL family protein
MFKVPWNKIILTSNDITTTVPSQFTCDGININPPLSWTKVPSGTESFVIIVDDPDAIPVTGFVFTHFAVVNLPKTLRELSAGQDFSLIPEAQVLINDSHTIGWYGPCPPPRSTHRYRFTIYAINKSYLPIGYTEKLTKEIFEKRFGDFILGNGGFIASYARTKSFNL